MTEPIKLPEALRLADVPICQRSLEWQSNATAELRRLHNENQAAHAVGIQQEREMMVLEAEVEECDRLRERMGELLTATAAALRGQPAPLTSHDWSSIPDRTAAVVNALCGAMEYAIELRAEVEKLRAELARRTTLDPAKEMLGWTPKVPK
jgi:hypothetical protein